MKERLNVKDFWKCLWMNFAPAALLCVVLTTTLSLLDWQIFNDENMVRCLSYCMTGALSGLCLSVLGSLLRKRYQWARWLDWLWAAAGGAVGIALVANKWQPAYWGMCIAIVFLCVHIACGRENQSLRLNQIASCFFSSLSLAIGLLLALQLCFYAVSSLFFSENWRIRNDLATLTATLSFLTAAPWLFLGRLPDADTPPEIRGGFRKVAAYLFLPAYLLLLGILLCYILMIAIRWEMPVGQMNGLALTALSLFVVLRLTLTGEENRLAGWFVRWGAWLLLPVIAVQQVGVWMRYAAYGLTPLRYAGMMVTLLLVLVVAWACAQKRADWFFVAAAAVALVLTVSPINADNVARWEQESRLKRMLVAYEMYDTETGMFSSNPDVPKEQQDDICSAAYYLRDLDNPPKGSFAYALQQQLVDEDGERIFVQDLFDFRTNERAVVKTYDVYGSNTGESVDVAGFRHAQWYSWWHDFDETEQEEAPLVPVETLLACADFPTETLLTEDVQLPDGRTLRICYLYLKERNGEMVRLNLRGWLLTP